MHASETGGGHSSEPEPSVGTYGNPHSIAGAKYGDGPETDASQFSALETQLPAADPVGTQLCVGICVHTWEACYSPDVAGPRPCCSASDMCVALSDVLGQCHPHWHVVQSGLSSQVLCQSPLASSDACVSADFAWWPPLVVHFAWAFTAKKTLLFLGGLTMTKSPNLQTQSVAPSIVNSNYCERPSSKVSQRAWTAVSDAYVIGTEDTYVCSEAHVSLYMHLPCKAGWVLLSD
jgi:hypothetical protein